MKIPSVAIRKYEEGKVSLTELTDIMRMNLLYQNGGLWVDTTVLVTEQITNQYVESQFSLVRRFVATMLMLVIIDGIRLV